MKKNYLKLLFLILLTALVFTSCSDDDDDDKKAWYDYSPELKGLGLTIEENGYLEDVKTAERIDYGVKYDDKNVPSRGDKIRKVYKVFTNDGFLEKETISYSDGKDNAYRVHSENAYSYEERRLVEIKRTLRFYIADNDIKTTYRRYKFAYDDAKKTVTVWQYKKEYDTSETLVEKRIHSTKDREFDYTEYFKKEGTKSLISSITEIEKRQIDHKKNIVLAYFYEKTTIPGDVSDETNIEWDNYYTEKFTYRDGSESKDITNADITEEPEFTTTRLDDFSVDSLISLSGNIKTITKINYAGNWEAIGEISEDQATYKYVWNFDNRHILSSYETYYSYQKELVLNNRSTYKYNTENDKRLTETKEEIYKTNGNLSSTEKIVITYNDEKKNATVKISTAIGDNELTENDDYKVYSLTKDGFVNGYMYKNYNSTKSLKKTDDGAYENPYKTVHEKEKVTKQGNKTTYELYQDVVNYNSDGSDERNRKVENYRKIIVEYY